MKDFQGKLPLILSGLFLTAIFTTSYLRIVKLQGSELFLPTILFVTLYLAWILVESKVAKKEIGQTQTNLDYYSLEIYALSRALVVLSGLILTSSLVGFGAIHVAGLCLFVGALAFRLIAIRQLGQFYSHRVRLREEHKIIDDGPYRFVRHPAYTGMILAHLGFSLFFFNPWTLGIWAFIHVPAVVYRILVEEEALFKIPDYAAYATNRKRLIPYIW